MEEYKNLEKMLKVYYNNIQTLHRHLIGANWFGNHEVLGKYYEKIQEDIDYLVELGLSIGIDEPTIQESLGSYKELEIIDRAEKESFVIVKGYFNDIVAQINRINDLPVDVINKLQEMQTFYRIESDYKLYRNNL